MTSLSALKWALAPLLLFSLISNLAVLISPLFMMQVLDRVVPSGNTATLFLLGALALSALLLQGGAEALRDLSLRRLGTWVEGIGSAQIVRGLAVSALTDPQQRDQAASHSTAVASLTQAVRGPVALAALSLPWLPLFMAALAMIHPGFVLLLGALLAGLLMQDGLLAYSTGRRQAAMLQGQKREQTLFQDAPVQGRRLGVTMITQHLLAHALKQQKTRHRISDDLDLPQALLGSLASLLRSSGQIMALGLGAYLVTQNQLTAGGMIAASLILSRSYASCELVLKQAPGLRQAWQDYKQLQAGETEPAQTLDLPPFTGALKVENLTCPRGGGARPYLDRVGFSLAAGECLVIVGGAGSGKTSLLRALSGLQPAPIGAVFYDDSAQPSLTAADMYRCIGVLPQRADLIAGSLADNIACFDPDRDDDAVLKAAQAAGVHGLIAALPDGYESDLSQTPHLLSAGQIQRIALARALYTRPRYLFLDEPNALLDGDGERALLQTLLRLKAAGTTIVMVLHRSGLMGMADQILCLDQGRAVDFGPRAEVLARLSGNQRRLRLPPLASSLHDLRDWVAGQFTRANDEAFSQKAQIIAQELFQLALDAMKSQTVTPQEVAFSLKFLNEFACEVQMIADPTLELEERLAPYIAGVASSRTDGAGAEKTPQALAALDRMGAQLRFVDADGVSALTADVVVKNVPVSQAADPAPVALRGAL